MEYKPHESAHSGRAGDRATNTWAGHTLHRRPRSGPNSTGESPGKSAHNASQQPNRYLVDEGKDATWSSRDSGAQTLP